MMMFLIVWNIITFTMMGIDKWKAIHKEMRISEKMLLSCSLLLGSLGTLLGMIVFRHKIRKPLFYISVPVMIIVHSLIILRLV
ncbi:DUF1294 domain-containing protein [Amedibacillus sp. YH-ame10]